MSGIETSGQEPEFAAFVGIDWADQKHVWCLQGGDSTKRESGELEHTPEAVEAWVAQLCQRFGNRPIAVAVGSSIWEPGWVDPNCETCAHTPAGVRPARH